MSVEYLEAVQLDGQTVNHLFTYLGAKLTHAADGKAVVEVPSSENFSQGGRMVAGGILATLADETMAHAVLSAIHPIKAAVTTEINVRYLRGADPAKAGTLTARAEVVKQGQAICFAEATVHDGRNRVLAKASATFYVMRESQ